MRKSPSQSKFFTNNKSKHIHTRINLGQVNKHDRYHLDQLEQRDKQIKKQVDDTLENFDKDLIAEMDKLIKASLEESKTGKS